MDLLDLGVRNLPATLFTHAHVPGWKVEWGTRYRTLPVTFPTDKAAGGEIIARLPLMADGLVHIDTDPDVIAIAAYPMTIEYMSARRNNTAVKREHLPDLAVLRRDRSVVFIDYEPCNEQERMPWLPKRTRELSNHIASHYGCAYAVHDERCLRAHPLFPNLKAMCAHKPTALDPPEIRIVIGALRRCRFPSRLGVLRKALHGDVELRAVFRVLDIGGADAVFTSVMQMCVTGELDIDLSKPFSDVSVVTARELRGA